MTSASSLNLPMQKFAASAAMRSPALSRCRAGGIDPCTERG
jgi:hypothetical protein